MSTRAASSASPPAIFVFNTALAEEGLLAAPSTRTLTSLFSSSASVGPAEYFDVEARDGQIILTPVRIQRGDAVRAKLAELDLGEADVATAVKWVRKRS